MEKEGNPFSVFSASPCACLSERSITATEAVEPLKLCQTLVELSGEKNGEKIFASALVTVHIALFT